MAQWDPAVSLLLSHLMCATMGEPVMLSSGPGFLAFIVAAVRGSTALYASLVLSGGLIL